MHIYFIFKIIRITYIMGFPDGSAVKNPPAIQETHKGDSVRSVLAWRKFHGQRSLVGLQSIRVAVRHD